MFIWKKKIKYCVVVTSDACRPVGGAKLRTFKIA